GRPLDVAQVSLTILALGCGHRDECKLCARHGLGIGGGKAQPVGAGISLDDPLQARLVQGHAMPPKPEDLLPADIDNTDLVAQVAETGSSGQPDIAGAQCGDAVHERWIMPGSAGRPRSSRERPFATRTRWRGPDRPCGAWRPAQG